MALLLLISQAMKEAKRKKSEVKVKDQPGRLLVSSLKSYFDASLSRSTTNRWVSDNKSQFLKEAFLKDSLLQL